jgi:hypothetical protein
MLLNPCFNRRPLPNPASCEFDIGVGEVWVTLNNLMDALRGDTE